MSVNKGRVFIAAKRAVQWAAAAVLIALTLLAVYIMVCNMRGRVATVFGTSILKVATGSMEPSIHEGDYILVKATDVSELEEGDIICFYSNDSAIYGMPNTHRIVRMLDDGSFITRGDANNIDDPVTVKADKIIGKYEGKIRFLRWINSFASVKKLIFALVFIGMTALAFYEVITIARVSSECKAQNERINADIRQAIDKEKAKLYEQGYDLEKDKKETDGR